MVSNLPELLYSNVPTNIKLKPSATKRVLSFYPRYYILNPVLATMKLHAGI